MPFTIRDIFGDEKPDDPKDTKVVTEPDEDEEALEEERLELFAQELQDMNELYTIQHSIQNFTYHHTVENTSENIVMPSGEDSPMNQLFSGEYDVEEEETEQ